MQHYFPQTSCQDYNLMDSYLHQSCLDGLDMDIHMGDWELYSSFKSTEDSSDISSILYFPDMNIDQVLFSQPIDSKPFMLPPEQDSPPSEELSSISNNQSLSSDIEDVFGWMEGSENSLLSEQTLIGEEFEGSLSSQSDMSTSAQASVVLPRKDMEVDNQLSVTHLLKAYAEAIESKQAELANVISSRLKEMVGPMGLTMERLAYYLIQGNQGDYLRQEANKNYHAALRAFYQVMPYGRFAHLTANLAILEAIPEEAETIHIVDFDLGDGIQWPSLMEAIGRQRPMRLTSIKWDDDGEMSPKWGFKNTKRHLCDYAQSVGLNLEMEEIGMEELMNKINKRGRHGEWLAFNCMVSLPHMGRKRSRRHVTEFLNAAKELVKNFKDSNDMQGITVLGNGDGAGERIKNFDKYLRQFHAMFESMELHFPSHLAEARINMECLFLEPYVSSLFCFGKHEEYTAGGYPLQLSGHDLEGVSFSKDNVEQAKQIVKERGSLYGVRVEGINDNVLSLEWRDTALVRVSTMHSKETRKAEE